MAHDTEESKRKELSERALDVFIQEGVSAQTMEGIADKVGVSKRTLYKYFPNKERLVEKVILTKMESIERQLIAVKTDGRPFSERLVGFFGVIERTIKPLANRLMHDVMANSPWIWKKIDEFRHDRILIHLEDLFVEGKMLGLLRGDLDLRVVMPIYFTIIESVGRPDFMLRFSVPPEIVIRTLIGILLGGVLSEKGRTEFAVAENGGRSNGQV
jgi:AcrR family transcriptional regulator